MTTQITLDAVVAEHIAAVNSFDLDAIMATFAENALVNDAAREFWGKDHIRSWVAREMTGDHVTMQPVDVVEHAGMSVVRCRFDGDYDKTGLPDPLIMTGYFRVENGKIVTLFVVKNNDPAY
jgi:limonene-1,2-epoxide hydrolase